MSSITSTSKNLRIVTTRNLQTSLIRLEPWTTRRISLGTAADQVPSPYWLAKAAWGIRTEDSEAAGYTESIKGVLPRWNTGYAELLAFPVSKIINSSFKEQCLPKIWKFADVSPLLKVKPVEDLKKHLRPISLTPCLSKVAEECVVVDYVKSAVLKWLST